MTIKGLKFALSKRNYSIILYSNTNEKIPFYCYMFCWDWGIN